MRQGSVQAASRAGNSRPGRAARPGGCPLPARLAAGLVFLASGSVLVLEVAGLRLVSPYVGLTMQSNSAVIGVALAAIAYGAWTGGWFADRHDARRLLGPVFLLAAAATAVLPPVVRYAGDLLRGSDPSQVLLLAAVTLFLPAALLSAVTPLVVTLRLGDLTETGRVVGRLSGIGTLGGITATIGTGFVLVAAVPTSTIVYGLAGLLATVGALMLWYGRRPGPQSGPQSGPRAGRGSGLIADLADGVGQRLAGVALLGVAGAGSALIAPDPCDLETAYHCAAVTVDQARPAGRILWLNGAQHSYVDLAEPRHLEYEYAQWMGAIVDAIAPPGRPISVLHLGGGGFTLPRYVAATRPGSVNLVVELDGQLVGVARRRLGLRPGERLRVAVGDARIRLAEQPAGTHDLIIGDTFGQVSVPWHLATREMAERVRAALRPGGRYALNVIDQPAGRFARAEIATVGSVFRQVAVIAPAGAITGRDSANWVILASDAPLPLAGPGRLTERLARLPRPVRPVTRPGLGRLIRGAPVLTDDRAPVDQLVKGW